MIPEMVLTARDNTKGAFDSAQRNLRELSGGINAVSDPLNKLIGGFGAVRSSMAGLAGALGISAMVSFSEGVIHATAALDDMAERTGATVTGLDKLSKVAKIGGHDMGMVETMMTRLTKALMSADEESKAAAKGLAAVGLSAADLKNLSPDQAIEKLAIALNQFDDTKFNNAAGKASVAIAVLGRSGQEALPFLKDLAENVDIAGKVTAEQAANAEKFEKALNRLSMQASSAAKTLARELIPSLNQAMSMLSSGGVLGTLSAGFAMAGRGGTSTRTLINEAQEQLTSLERQGKAPGSIFSGGMMGTINDASMAEVRGRIQALRALEREQALAGAGDVYSNEGRSHTPSRRLDILNINREPSGPRGVGGGGRSRRQEITEGKLLIDQLQEELQRKEKISRVDDLLEDIARGKYKTMTEGQQAFATFLAGEIDQREKLAKVAKKNNDDYDEAQKKLDEKIAAETLAIKSADELAKAYLLDAEYSGKSNEERQIAIELLRLEAAGVDKTTGRYHDLEASMRTALVTKQAAEARQKQIEEWKKTVDDIDKTFNDGFVRMLEGGKGSFKSFADSLRNSFKSLVADQIYKMLLRPFVVNVVGNMVGGGPSGGGFGATGGGGGNGLMQLLNIGQSAYSLYSGSAASTLDNAMSFVGNTLAGEGAAAAAYAETASVLEAGSAAAGTTAAAAIPYIGWIIAIAGLLYSALGKGGGPKGELRGGFNFEGTPDRYQESPDLTQSVQAFEGQYQSLARTLGGVPEQIQSMIRLAVDPQGDAGTQMLAQLRIGDTSEGAALDYHYYTDSANREMGALQGEVSQQFQRMMLAALSQTDLYDTIDALLKGFDPLKATAEQVADKMNQVNAAMAALNAQSANYTNILQGIIDVMGETHNMFSDSSRNIRMGLLDNTGKYNFLDQEAARQMDVLRSLTDPNLIRDYASRINSTINSAYGLLTPEQQAANANAFIDRLTQADTLTQQRLQASVDAQEQAFKDLPAAMRTAIEAAMDRAVGMIAAAVPRQIAVDVRVDTPAKTEVGIR